MSLDNVLDKINHLIRHVSRHEKALDRLEASELIKVATYESTESQAYSGVQPYDDTDVSNPPTDAELDAALGTPTTVGAGYVAVLDDNGGGANVYLVASDGSNWWHVALTKSV